MYGVIRFFLEGLIRFFFLVFPHGVIHQRVIHQNFIMHFNAQKSFPGLYEGRNGRLQKKLFLAAKNGGHTPGGYTSGITVLVFTHFTDNLLSPPCVGMSAILHLSMTQTEQVYRN